MEMRKALHNALANVMRKNDKVCVIDADLAKANGTWDLRNEFPERALDVGIAENNMASVAAGLSTYGYIPFISSFAAFATRNVADQIYISVCYAKQNVKIIGSAPGIFVAKAGGTHMSFDDISIFRSFPDMVIFEPADAIELTQAIEQITDHYGPLYLRMPRGERPAVHDEQYRFDLFKADTLRSGSDVSILASGFMVEPSLRAAEQLKADGIDAEVINVHTIKPLDRETILASVKKTGKVITCENHNVFGGLYSAVSELLCNALPCKVETVAVYDQFGQVGLTHELAVHYKLTSDEVVRKVKAMF